MQGPKSAFGNSSPASTIVQISINSRSEDAAHHVFCNRDSADAHPECNACETEIVRYKICMVFPSPEDLGAIWVVYLRLAYHKK